MSGHLNEIIKTSKSMALTISHLRETTEAIANYARTIKDEEKRISILAYCFNLKNLCADLEAHNEISIELIMNTAEIVATRRR